MKAIEVNRGFSECSFGSYKKGWTKASSVKSMGCASAATAGGGVCGDSDGGAGVGIDRIGKPSVETFTMAGGLDRASATTLSEPGVCLRSVVNSDTKARWR